jgi:CBS domain-containing protein
VRELARRAFDLASDMPVYEALARMREQGEQLAVVTTGDRVVGVLSVTDILRRVLPSTERLQARN